MQTLLTEFVWKYVMVLGTRWLVPIHKEVYETVHQYNASPKQLKKDDGGEII